MVRIPLEDNFGDIIGKAQRGLRLSDTDLAHQARISPDDLRELRSGAPITLDDSAIRNLATALNLAPDALLASARASWHPRDQQPLHGFAAFTTPFNDMTVNAYLVFDPKTRQAAVFDTGADADPILHFIRDNQLTLASIFLTHTHTDHVFDLDRLKRATTAKAWVSDREPLPGAEPFPDGQQFPLSALTIETRRTSGHARGGTTFVVTGFTPTPRSGLAKRLAIVGDALFAGSIGGGMVSYDEALRTNRAAIFTLPDDTILCPGHGPLTTVGEEKLHNPFFPEFAHQQTAQQQ